ncbi:LysR family transcriptional regulator [Pseudoalteromonas luteoviolacea]|uniref:HTH lysR-type domain-containing protein n=1 Tax=Pseudoalteromonas luteoviolacea S4054 TaxID=1129367 RepID=A0A0F6A9L1_9GAMM|nr:LysR family transcriptional regulator [Pseudoalteromonas luteoviolacea]AOT08634.1 hypothetical protein S4054249_12560 [Pseudoalteromonas luteoviolacea]AOT13549.1 hypothetical protein S40542_12535 [Pseudoalteromonas luteoviolacea]AOT18462.1 hypothetical protein S4054_12535 [Pseudoalteromonas luteoviolacea]KKE82541.1 hypothetical protein N479_18205 [Pseudoalteromonas luteoviolacea S4054]KZN72078.1 hypothetical protein N481_16840 [Pseudoalteromonas luteoviolacea S4047-1]
MKNVSMQALKVFDAAARHGSFKLAADELSLTATAVSHHIKNLESRLDIELFTRKTREVALTKAGNELAQATTLGFGTIERALHLLVDQNLRVEVHTTSSFAAQMLIPALRDFTQLHPNIEVSVITGEHLVHDNKAITIRFGDVSQIDKRQTLSLERFNLYANRNFDCNNQNTVFIPKWKNQSLPEAPWHAWLNRNQMSNTQYELISYDQELYCIQEAIAGSGFVFASHTLVRPLEQSGVLTAHTYQPICSKLGYYLSSQEVRYSQQQQIFVDWLRTRFT